ncbi:MAG: 3-methyl-2-oxobutanoate dehydrogenase subunit VorB [Proteobacteria bacterium]|nr:3-methyl-2-oxobutanoate dehydrogenase subunit VorB [Pseudomonadota bacterium]
MQKEFIKGNEAVVKGAILAGCTHYFGYPITPASEIAHAAAFYLPPTGGIFIQAESEVAAINMVYGAAGAGARVMTASSGPGISLKAEGFSYLAGAELPCVIVDVMRAGPGLGNIYPEQGDYNQIVKGAGHGNYKNIVLAPNSVQEMADHGYMAFELAEKYRNPLVILTDAYIGQMMEPVQFPKEVKKVKHFDWAIYADKASRHNLITSIVMSADELEKHNIKLNKKYAEMEKNDTRFEGYKLDDADVVFVAYGVSSRIVMSAVDILREKNIKAGLLRPITLFPFPKKACMDVAGYAKRMIAVELSNGQMVDDVRLAVKGKKEIEFYGRMGGMTPSVEEIVSIVE